MFPNDSVEKFLTLLLVCRSLNNPWFLSNVCKLAVVTTALCAAAVYLEIKYIYVNPKRERNQDQKSKKDD